MHSLTHAVPDIPASNIDISALRPRCPPPQLRASLAPRSPSILSRSSSSHFYALQASVHHVEKSSAATQTAEFKAVERQHSTSFGSGNNRDAVPLPLQPSTNLLMRSASAPPSQISPSESPLGLPHHLNDDISHLGFSAASLSSPSESDSADSPFRVDHHGTDFWHPNSTPMTPSRAGAKALQVLGSQTTPGKTEKKSRGKPNKDCFRPLPRYLISLRGYISKHTDGLHSLAAQYRKRSIFSSVLLLSIAESLHLLSPIVPTRQHAQIHGKSRSSLVCFCIMKASGRRAVRSATQSSRRPMCHCCLLLDCTTNRP